jgi:hypothetical protein
MRSHDKRLKRLERIRRTSTVKRPADPRDFPPLPGPDDPIDHIDGPDPVLDYIVPLMGGINSIDLGAPADDLQGFEPLNDFESDIVAYHKRWHETFDPGLPTPEEQFAEEMERAAQARSDAPAQPDSPDVFTIT